jgi:hypothetical protein
MFQIDPRCTVVLALAVIGCSRPPVPPMPTPDPDDQVPQVAAPAVSSPAPLWTLRIHSDEDATRAEEIASVARTRFDQPVEVVLGGGAAHVDLTGFPSEEAARAFLAVAKERGYRSASVIPQAPNDAH